MWQVVAVLAVRIKNYWHEHCTAAIDGKSVDSAAFASTQIMREEHLIALKVFLHCNGSCSLPPLASKNMQTITAQTHTYRHSDTLLPLIQDCALMSEREKNVTTWCYWEPTFSILQKQWEKKLQHVSCWEWPHCPLVLEKGMTRRTLQMINHFHSKQDSSGFSLSLFLSLSLSLPPVFYSFGFKVW